MKPLLVDASHTPGKKNAAKNLPDDNPIDFCFHHVGNTNCTGLDHFDDFRFFHFFNHPVVNNKGIQKIVGCFRVRVGVREEVEHDTTGNEQNVCPLFKGNTFFNYKYTGQRLSQFFKLKFCAITNFHIFYRSPYCARLRILLER